MRFNKLWIDELVPNSIDANELADKITMAGLEVDSVDDVCASFTGVVVAEVLTCVDHPDSDHLHVTTVNVGGEVLDMLDILKVAVFKPCVIGNGKIELRTL